MLQVQLVMDQTVRDRELELDEVRRQRNDLREQNEQLKKRQNGDLLQAVRRTAMSVCWLRFFCQLSYRDACSRWRRPRRI